MKYLSYDQKGRLEFDEPWVRIILGDDGVLLEARTYCPVTEMDLDCTNEFSSNETWMNRIIQDFCDRESACEPALLACHG